MTRTAAAQPWEPRDRPRLPGIAVPRRRVVLPPLWHFLRTGSLAASLAACGQGSASDDDGAGASSTTGPAPASSSSSGDPDPGSTGAATTTSESSGTPADSTGVVDGEPFEVVLLDRVWLSSFEASQFADAELDLGAGPFASVRMVVELESPCFPFEGWVDTPPPEGHNWPAKCDAFDRIVNVVADPEAMDGPFSVELMRGITPFGGPQIYENDLTDWATMHPGVHTLRGFISTWTDGAGQVSGAEGGWFMTLRVQVDPGPPPSPVLAAIPLVHADVTAANAEQTIAFELPEGTTSARIDYVVSGHGGGAVGADCIGPADEFCHRVHTLHFDDTELGSFDPWRDDCVSLCTIDEFQWPDGSTFDYCTENPCGSIASVQAPRANWCPSAPVDPVAIDLGALATPGMHTFSFAIDGIAEGGVWPTSAMIYAYGE